ncbi:MAG: NAD-dependent 4,6-dehydratase LegB [Azonexus sp.]|jgi:NAD dependent epimerase/dehydratase|nr:NAD-dependent 4,6-dehydratase LegB [Nitrospira sp.]HNE42264.1 NAD-dependent 4,6-dehydratase LegB [Rhodocyclaceae bacterium]HNM21017.1 NAD-dependent 4,6-dehydratase LegB [Rhodocyclaceae bacterium]HNN40799.1 NAD-dependent 4,6-dehydratase LegB [Nitrospira sp.]
MYYAGKNVLVTGADGFIGSHLTEMLVRAGAEVTALSQYNSFNNWGWLEDVDLSRNVKVVCGDIRDPHFCRTIVQGSDTVFHLAALIAIPFSYVAPDSYVSTNIQGSLNLVQAARDLGVRRFIQTSTSEVYGTAQYVPINEEHPLQPQSPYSASKIAADAMVMSYFLSFGTPVTIVRPFNTYGPRQSARAVIPTVITQLLSGKDRLHLGSLHPTRDFNYVEDTCRGFLELAGCPDAVGKTVNVGSNFEISVGDTVALIQEIIGTKVPVETDDQRLRPERSEVERLWCDNSKIRALTGFSPRVGIKEGLERTVEWLRQPANLSKYKSNIYNV